MAKKKKKGKSESDEISKQNIGNAGEYYIASKLSQRNFIVTITLGRAEKFDILALSPKNKLIKISVKTTILHDTKSFPLSVKDETGGSPDFFYAFVKFDETGSNPDFWIVPSLRINEILQHSSKKYFNEQKRKDGKPHNDKGIRRLDFIIRGKRNELYLPGWETEWMSYHKNIEQLFKD